MTVRDYFDILSRRKWIIVVTFVLVLAAVVAITLLATPIYGATTLMRVLPISGGTSTDWVTYDTKQIDRLMNTYAEFATSRPVLQELVQRLGLESWPQIVVEILTNTELMQVTAEAEDPVIARDTANTLAEILIAQSRTIYTGSGKTAQEILGEQLAQVRSELELAWTEYENLIAEAPGDTDRITAASRTIGLKEETYATLLEQYERNRVRDAVLANTLSVVEPAIAPRVPTRPNKQLNLALGIAVGLFGGIGLAFLLESLDTTLYAIEQISKAAQMPILGKVPNAGRQTQPVLFGGSSPQGEAFRQLRTNLLMLDREQALRSVLVTSAAPTEGKSTVAANLAFSMAQSGRSVVVVDGHLRLPSLHKIFDLTNRVGVSSVLEGKATLREALQNSKTSGVHVLTSGPLPPDPAELVSSPQMMALVEQLREEFDLVVLDAPALLAVTDAAALTRAADGVILAVERAQARQESVRAASQQLADVRANTLGVVVNRVELDSVYDYYMKVPT